MYQLLFLVTAVVWHVLRHFAGALGSWSIIEGNLSVLHEAVLGLLVGVE